jgi:transposase-like protein
MLSQRSDSMVSGVATLACHVVGSSKQMTRPFSCYLKQKMVERLSGTNAMSAAELARQTGITQQNLSRWLQEATSLPFSSPSRAIRAWTVEQKAQIIALSSELDGDLLAAYLDREGVKTAELKRWRSALDEAGEESVGVTKRIRGLERELARRDRALAEAASLLMLGESLESNGDAADEAEPVDEASNRQYT